MVSKSYVVNECPQLADDDDECVKNTNMQSTEQQMKGTKIDRYMLHITNEIVSDKEKKRKEKRRSKTRTVAQRRIRA
jgi:hypothetical protein